MANLYGMFKDLLPDSALLVGTVEASNGDQHQVTLVDGGRITARGKATVGGKVFVRNGLIEGAAPDLTLETIEV